MTPYELELILNIYTRPDIDKNVDAPIFKPTIRKFLKDRLIVETGGRYFITRRGMAFCDMLCALQLPEIAWIDPKTKEIISYETDES